MAYKKVPIGEFREINEKEAKKYFDTIDKINTLSKELWNIYYPLLNIIKDFQSRLKDTELSEKDVNMITKLLNSLAKQTNSVLQIVEHVDKVVGKIQNSSFNVTYNINDLSKKFLKLTKVWEKDFHCKLPSSKERERMLRII